jgi:hypothetical protein
MRGMRHTADIYEPSGEPNDLGNQTDGPGRLIDSKVPCSLETLTSREMEIARLLHATATHRVMMYANPKIPLKHCHWLMIDGRKMNIAEVKLDDRSRTYDLTVGEVVA